MSKYWNNGKFCTQTDKIPDTEHYAIVYNESIHVPGDERSRTNPGHGYPERTHPYTVYVAFEKEEDWKLQIQEMVNGPYRSVRDFKAMHVKPAKVERQVSVRVG